MTTVHVAGYGHGSDRKFTVVCSVSPQNVEFGHFTLFFFFRKRQRNVPTNIAATEPFLLLIKNYCFVTFSAVSLLDSTLSRPHIQHIHNTALELAVVIDCEVRPSCRLACTERVRKSSEGGCTKSIYYLFGVPKGL